MPTLLHPGVYVSEAPGGVRSIEGAPTSTTIFVGETERGPLGPTKIKSRTDYERLFGGYFRDHARTQPAAGPDARADGLRDRRLLPQRRLDGVRAAGDGRADDPRRRRRATAGSRRARPVSGATRSSVAYPAGSGNDDATRFRHRGRLRPRRRPAIAPARRDLGPALDRPRPTRTTSSTCSSAASTSAGPRARRSTLARRSRRDRLAATSDPGRCARATSSTAPSRSTAASAVAGASTRPTTALLLASQLAGRRRRRAARRDLPTPCSTGRRPTTTGDRRPVHRVRREPPAPGPVLRRRPAGRAHARPTRRPRRRRPWPASRR